MSIQFNRLLYWRAGLIRIVIGACAAVLLILMQSCALWPEQRKVEPKQPASVSVAGQTATLGRPVSQPAATRLAATVRATPEPSAIAPLSTPNSPPARIVIPDLGIDAPVVEVGWRIVGDGDRRHSEWETADNAAGHHLNSASPGQVGNVVIAGHHNTKGKVFEQISRDVDRKEPRLKSGSAIQVYTADGRAYTYRVQQVLLLQDVGVSEQERKDHAAWLAPTKDPTLTLITCWPFWTNTHRVVVVARLDLG